MTLDSLIRAAWRTQYQAFQVKMHGNLDKEEEEEHPRQSRKGLSRGEMIRRQKGTQKKGKEKDSDEDMRGEPRRNLGINKIVQKHLGIGRARKGGGKGAAALSARPGRFRNISYRPPQRS
ncbi:hypothetical protein Pmar_PMAR009639 [Perkinsus marinus ATCC 50983]|uniref:Uncharacterized protein n=1 Tax=Perkinsus marinus (strain ATCC 50983 / TXsc) TaxID=423536 RepID=C5M021_PERM5|nr:hypothetical protein Pmar_PMAR009639 [Perkinsus marinus ATCC 50983]EEQ97679.1 hypothetical protein Pmar_PMAR009639 [Perkinsus marinus ATCC 50983]|eukprot:XP_002764962.1 hypothetical protein Pmar_PMAR009639 [Perkinsus marinus ATCC 50983]